VTEKAASGAFRLPAWNDSWGWLMFYNDALAGDCGQVWQDFAHAHVPSGRTDGTSWKKWRDEAMDAAKTMPGALAVVTPNPDPSASGATS
jgi:hypothetical protein